MERQLMRKLPRSVDRRTMYQGYGCLTRWMDEKLMSAA